MFGLTVLEHKLRLPPSLLNLPIEQALRSQLESIFLDKVIGKLGLCVSVYDIKSIDGGFILHNEGAPTYTVVFRVIMFRPFVGEVIAAKVKDSNSKGLQLTLGFFEDIYIPQYSLRQPARADPHPADPNKVTWVWQFNDEDYHIHEDNEIRFRVTDVKYPTIPLEQEEGSKPFAPMLITGAINDDGLGVSEWW